MKHLTEEDLVLLYYGESAAEPGAANHLKECDECRTAAGALARTMNLCNEWLIPEPPPELGRSVWAQIAPRLEDRQVNPKRPHRLFWLVPALCGMLLFAFLAGRSSRHPAPSFTAGLSEHARQRILAISLADHLDRAGMLLTEISNAADTGTADFSPARYRAQDLVEEGRLLLQTIRVEGDSADGGQTATAALLDEVERFMLEIANAPDHVTPVEVKSLQERISTGSLLFKVRIIESNLRSEGLKS